MSKYTFQVNIKKNGVYEKIDGTPLFPFRWGELLDERLDEAYVDLIGSTTESFDRTTPVEIIIKNDDDKSESKQYFIIASDESNRFPVWSVPKTYKHTLHLIEHTKLLEGIICPSLTFTNELGCIFVSKHKELAPSGLGKPYIDYLPKISASYLPGEISFPAINEIIEYELNGTKYNVMTHRGDNKGFGYDSILKADDDKISEVKLYDENNTYTYTFKSDDFANETITFKNVASGRTYTLSYVIVCKANSQSMTQTITYNNVFVVKSYLPLKRITITDAINRILACAEPLVPPRNEPRYKLNSGQATEFENIYAPEFSLTQCTLREQLKTVGAFIHAEPWLDENDEIYFKPYAKTSACPLTDKPFVYEGVRADINEYNTALYSNAQNLVSTDKNKSSVCSYPSDAFQIAPRSETVYVMLADGNAKIITQEKIHSIVRVWCNENDITNYVYESVEYNNNLSSFDANYPYSKSWAIYYTIGSNVIDGLFYTAPEAIATNKNYAIANILNAVTERPAAEITDDLQSDRTCIGFRIEYIPISSAVVTHGKQKFVKGQTPFAKLYNQGESEIESTWYGENLKGAAARLGNVDVERTYYLDSFDKIPEVAQALDGYCIATVNTEVLPQYLKCTVGLTKDFNRLSEYIGVSSVKRMYEISERQVAKRDIHIHRTLVLGKMPDKVDSVDKTLFYIDGIADIFKANSSSKDESQRNICNVRLDVQGYDGVWRGVILPVVSYALGNVCTFSFSFKDNYSAGDKLVKKVKGEISSYWGTDVPYTDYYGRVKKVDAYFLTYGEMLKKVGKTDDSALKLSFPEYGKVVLGNDNDGFEHYVDKDSREVLSYTIELEAKTTFDNVIIGSGLARLCTYVSGKSRENTYSLPRLYLAKTPIDRFANVIDTTDASKYYDVGELGVYTKNDNTFTICQSCEIYPTLNDGEYYGLIVATPTVLESVTALDDGEEITQSIYSGGDVVFQKEEAFEIINHEISGGNAAANVDERIMSIYFYIESE